MSATTGDLDPRFTAAVDMIGRCGASGFQIRYSDDEEPTVWMAVALFDPFEAEGDSGIVLRSGRFDCAAAPAPLAAVLRLLDQMVDGGSCTHCNRPTGIDSNLVPDRMPLSELFCWYQFDPELATFRRGCEGS